MGVTAPLLQGEKHIPFPIHLHTVPNMEELEGYLFKASIASQLALFRDIQLNYDLLEYPEMYGIVVEAFDKSGLTDEVKRMSETY